MVACEPLRAHRGYGEANSSVPFTVFHGAPTLPNSSKATTLMRRRLYDPQLRFDRGTDR